MHALDRPLPQNPEAERAVLGSILINKDAFHRIGHIVTGDDFHKEAHRAVFAAIAALADSQRDVDLLTLKDELKKSGHLDRVGGSAYIASLVDGIPDVANVERYAALVKEAAQRRFLIAEAQRVQESAVADNVADVASSASNAFASLASSVDGGAMTVRMIAKDAVARLDRKAGSDQWLTGVATGLRQLDGVSLGLQRGVLSVLGARPGRGKTTAAISVALHAIRTGLRVYFVEADMSVAMIGDRLLATVAGVNSFKVRTGQGMTLEEFQRVVAAERELHALDNLLTVDTRSRDIARITAAIRREVRQRGVDLLIVDHIGHVRGGRGDARYLQIGDVSSRLIDLAGETDCAVLALCQLGRDAEDREPSLSDLRESGNLEQDARLVVLLDRPYLRDRSTPQCTLTVSVAKNEGELHRFAAHFDLETQRMTDEGACRHCRS